MRVYVASRFSNRGRVKKISTALAAVGIETVQTWPDEHDSSTRKQAAERDIREIDRADSLLLLTEDCEAVPGGMHFEAGYALGTGKHVWVVGPPVHVFCELPESYRVFRFPDIQSFIKEVSEAGRNCRNE